VRAVQTAEIANEPTAIKGKDFRVFATAQIIAKNNAIGGRTPEFIPRAVVQRINIAKSVIATDDEERVRVFGHVYMCGEGEFALPSP
jgi:hypothetical protein